MNFANILKIIDFQKDFYETCNLEFIENPNDCSFINHTDFSEKQLLDRKREIYFDRQSENLIHVGIRPYSELDYAKNEQVFNSLIAPSRLFNLNIKHSKNLKLFNNVLRFIVKHNKDDPYKIVYRPEEFSYSDISCNSVGSSNKTWSFLLSGNLILEIVFNTPKSEYKTLAGDIVKQNKYIPDKYFIVHGKNAEYQKKLTYVDIPY